MTAKTARATLLLVAAFVCGSADGVQLAQARNSVATISIPFSDVAPVLGALRSDLLPLELIATPTADVERGWRDWVSRRDQAIRARLLQGDEDTVLNLLLLGTSFTGRPRLTELADLREAGKPMEIFLGRVEDLVTALSSSRSDERARFVREVLDARGLGPSPKATNEQIRSYLIQNLERVIRETEAYARASAAMGQTDDPIAKLVLDSRLYSERGLSSDTSIVPGFALDRAFSDLGRNGFVRSGTIRRVAIIGPGLDVIDRREGRDFYPVQTIQPFLVLDSLLRLGLASGDVRLTTFDVSARVNSHLEVSRERAVSGEPYAIQLALNAGQWTSDFVHYWETAGGTIGNSFPASAPGDLGSDVSVRGVRVRPDVVMSIEPRDMNIVLQRLDISTPEERFDLVIGTNVLIYYNVFEQSLAVANIAHMLRPGGIFLSNNLVAELPHSPLTLAGFTDVVYTHTGLGDRVLWYGRQ